MNRRGASIALAVLAAAPLAGRSQPATRPYRLGFLGLSSAGVGRALVAFAEEHARELGCDGTWLVSGLHRKEEAHIFYQSLGFEKTGCRFVKWF